MGFLNYFTLFYICFIFSKKKRKALNNFYKSKIRHKENDIRIEINFTNINGVLSA